MNSVVFLSLGSGVLSLCIYYYRVQYIIFINFLTVLVAHVTCAVTKAFKKTLSKCVMVQYIVVPVFVHITNLTMNASLLHHQSSHHQLSVCVRVQGWVTSRI